MRLWLLITLHFSCIGIFVLMAKSGAMNWLNAGPGDGYAPYMGQLALVLNGVLLFAVPALVYANVFPAERFRWFRLDRKVAPAAVVYGVLAFIAINLGLELVLNWLDGFVTNPELKELQELGRKHTEWVMQMPGIGALLLALVVNALVPAVCEELFFRGAVQQLLTEWTKRPAVAIFFSSVFFALLHFSNVGGLPVIFFFGMLLGFAFYWTGSLRTSIYMHFAFNAFSVIDSYIGQHSPAYRAWSDPGYVAVTGFVLGAGFLYLLWKQSRKLI